MEVVMSEDFVVVGEFGGLAMPCRLYPPNSVRPNLTQKGAGALG